MKIYWYLSVASFTGGGSVILTTGSTYIILMNLSSESDHKVFKSCGEDLNIKTKFVVR